MSTSFTYNEKELLARVAGGDEFAFSQLFNHWQNQLAAYIFRITQSREMVEEIVQDVFLKIWMSREALTEIGNFKSYLLVVSRNHALNSLRKAMREIQQKKIYQAEFKEITDNPQTTLLSLIDAVIDSLPPRQKEVYLLHRQERLSYQQIAAKLQIGHESVKTHLKLAVKAIKSYLGSLPGIKILVCLLFFKNL